MRATQPIQRSSTTAKEGSLLDVSLSRRKRIVLLSDTLALRLKLRRDRRCRFADIDRVAYLGVAIALVDYQAGNLLFEFWRTRTTLLGPGRQLAV